MQSGSTELHVPETPWVIDREYVGYRYCSDKKQDKSEPEISILIKKRWLTYFSRLFFGRHQRSVLKSRHSIKNEARRRSKKVKEVGAVKRRIFVRGAANS
jgi:hypothetical protein